MERPTENVVDSCNNSLNPQNDYIIIRENGKMIFRETTIISLLEEFIFSQNDATSYLVYNTTLLTAKQLLNVSSYI